jgi:hypothetical protein
VSWALRLLYGVALIAPIVPVAVFAGSAWIAQNASASAWSLQRIAAVLLVLARFVFVMARRRALQAYVAVPLVRRLSIAAMMIGSILAVGSFWARPITLYLFGTSSDPEAWFLRVVMVFSQGAYLAPIGVVVFELDRAIGELQAAFARLADRWRARGR